MRGHVAGSTLGLLLGVASCSPPNGEDPAGTETNGTATEEGMDGEPAERGVHLDLYLDDGIEVCGGQLAAYDRFIERAFEFWTQAQIPSDFRLSVYASDASPCPRAEHSCASGGSAFVVRQFGAYHELVHAFHQTVDGNSASALNEGVATALGADYPLTGAAPFVVDSEILFSSYPDSYDYLPLGLFVRFLIERDGVDVVRGLFQALVQSGDPDQEQIEQQFEQALGEPLADTWADFTSEPRCAYDFSFCGDQTPIELPYTMPGLDCDDPDVLGFSAPHLYDPPDRPYMPMQILNLRVDEPTWIQIDSANVSVRVGQCGGCSEQRLLSLGSSGNAVVTSFELDRPGTYVFIATALALDEPPRMSIAPGCSPDGVVATPPYSCP